MAIPRQSSSREINESLINDLALIETDPGDERV